MLPRVRIVFREEVATGTGCAGGWRGLETLRESFRPLPIPLPEREPLSTKTRTLSPGFLTAQRKVPSTPAYLLKFSRNIGLFDVLNTIPCQEILFRNCCDPLVRGSWECFPTLDILDTF